MLVVLLYVQSAQGGPEPVQLDCQECTAGQRQMPIRGLPLAAALIKLN